MSSSFEKYIKAAIESKKYSVVCEMASVIHPDRKNIKIMSYPGNDIRVYKNRDDEVRILCPKNPSVIQESNLTKAIATGTIFEDADTVGNYSDFLVKTKMPIVAMANKGLENPYKLKEITGSTIGVMNEDGDVEVTDTDIENGRNVIDDLLEKDSKEFKDVKNVVDDYLDNENHEFGYEKDFTYDIQQLRDEIQQFKDADLDPEDTINPEDWDDNWGSTTSLLGDYIDAENDEKSNESEYKMDISDDDDEEDDNEYKVKEECGTGCINIPSKSGNVNVAMEEDDTTTPKPMFSSGPEFQNIQENDSPIEVPSVTPPPANITPGEPKENKKMKPEDPDSLNKSPSDMDGIAPGVKLESFQEGFGLLRPKKLKAIDVRSIVSYVTVEMNAIKDSNDQAMLAGYVCSKLELIDFYITVIDTHDDRYVVPHSRQYLVDGQKQLTDLLTQILKIRPVDRNDRLWKAILS